ncbi:hypothetical protein AB1Y20_016235 [Prymnesium parvum]|uniref:Uncharacterized protein n=1 Tax=Prymnesium parvum TaxID=97485 RepID=A0AB34IES2_PRYPA
MLPFSTSFPASIDEARASCTAWLRHHFPSSSPASSFTSAAAAAAAEASRWTSLALVSLLSPAAAEQLALALAPELRALEHTILLPLLYEMAFMRAACKQLPLLNMKPPETVYHRPAANDQTDQNVQPAAPAAAGSPTAGFPAAALRVPRGPWKVLVVVARYDEDLSWLQSLPDGAGFHVMQKDSPPPHASLSPQCPRACLTLVPNVGRESHSYLSFLAERCNADTSPHAVEWPQDKRRRRAVDTLVFAQGNPFDHNPRFLEDVRGLIPAGWQVEDGEEAEDDVEAKEAAEEPQHEWRGGADDAPPRFTFLPLGQWHGGERILYSDPTGAPHQPRLVPLARVWAQLFGAAPPLPPWLGFTPGGCFAIPLRAARARRRAFYERARRGCGLEAAADPIAGHAFERLWRYIFVPMEGGEEGGDGA